MNALGTAAVDDWTEVNEHLRGAAPLDVLQWAVDRFHPRLTMATAFGAEGCVLLDLLAKIEPRVRVFNLDTGYQFAETLELRDRIAERYGIEVELIEARHIGRRVRASAWRAVVCGKLRPVLLRSENRAVAAGIGRLRRLDHGDSIGSVDTPGQCPGRGEGPEIRPREDQPALDLDQA